MKITGDIFIIRRKFYFEKVFLCKSMTSILGVIGLAEDSIQLLRWIVCGPSLPYNLEASLSEQTKHHEQTPSAQKWFSKNVNDLVSVFQEAGNPFLEESKDLIALDSKNIPNQNAVDNIRKVAESGAKQLNEFFEDRLKEKKISIYEIIKKNKFVIFTQPSKPNKAWNKMEITTLKKSCQHFSRLHIACQVRDGNLDEFFSHENGSYPPSTSENGDLMPGSKSDLLHCLEKFYKEAATDNMTMNCIILDGAAIVNMIKPTGVRIFQEYATQNFKSYIKKLFQRSERIDTVWDVYVEDSLKSSARHQRGNNINRKGARVLTIIIIKKN